MFAFDDWIKEEPHLIRLLDASELQRSQRFHFAEDRRRARLGHAIVRLVLGRALNVDPSKLRFTTGVHGKPLLLGERLCFNVSHTKSLLALATAPSEIGVDIEGDDRRIDVDLLASGILQPDEMSQFRRLDRESRRTFLLRLWTEREAFVKATGEGLTARLESFVWSPVNERSKRVLRRPQREETKWCTHYLGSHSGHHVSFANEGIKPCFTLRQSAPDCELRILASPLEFEAVARSRSQWELRNRGVAG